MFWSPFDGDDKDTRYDKSIIFCVSLVFVETAEYDNLIP